MRGLPFNVECVLGTQAHSLGVHLNGSRVSHYSAGGLVLDPRARLASLDGQPLELTRTEFDLLVLLASRDGAAVPAADIVRHLWGSGNHKAGQVVQVHVCNIRRKLGENARSPRLLHTVRGYGYALRDGETGRASYLNQAGTPQLKASVWVTVTGSSSFSLSR